MAMTWTSLTSPKGTSGSIATWVNYTKLDLPTVLDEAQSLLFSMLRVREMKTEWTFGLAVGQSQVALPDRFLDPDSSIYVPELGMKIAPVIEQRILDRRMYDNSFSGTFATDPFSFTEDSTTVVVAAPANGLTQGSTITIAGATDAGGLSFNGTFPVDTIIDADHFVITMDTAAQFGGVGGGASATWTANQLISSTPGCWAVWDQSIKFDTAFDTANTGKLIYYRSPVLLSSTNQSNWLTARYPRLLRVATQAAAADFMKDDQEYQKGVTALGSMIQGTAAENDLIYRGAVFGTETPHGG